MFLELGIDIPLFGMVKDNRHHFRALVGPGGELPLRVGSPVFALFGQISDEVHRFTIAYHKGARGKASRRSVLEEIPGVGASRRRALLAHFGSVKRIAQAGEEELCKVRGVSPELAAAIRGYFEEEQERKNR
jgi:excinuclease ABC subunit C